MAIYESATSAIRDTVKWLTAFLPATALTAAALIVGPKLVASARASVSIADWTSSHWPVITLIVALFGSITWLLYVSQQVLTVRPVDLADLQAPANEHIPAEASPRADVARAMGSGIAMPYFFDKATYDKELVAIADATAANYQERASRLALAGDAIRQWSIYDRIQAPYKRFKWAFVLATGVIGTFLVLAPAQFDTPSKDGPTRVLVDVNDDGKASLRQVTGCTDASTTAFYLNSGSWDAPRLLVDGAGCAFRAAWEPRPQDVEVRPVPKP